MTTRDLMLDIARQAILLRASLDGYQPEEYNPESDDEGYAISLLIALRHWTDVHGRDWTAELDRAQQLFEEDLGELQDGSAVALATTSTAIHKPSQP